MRKALVLLLVLGLASAATAGPSIVEDSLAGSGVLTIANDEPLNYGIWLEIVDPAVANFDGDPVLTPGANPAGNSAVIAWPDFGAWYEVQMTSFDPANQIGPGDHVIVNIAYSGPGETVLNLWNGNADAILDSAVITPEPMSLMLLGLGGLFLRRRK